MDGITFTIIISLFVAVIVKGKLDWFNRILTDWEGTCRLLIRDNTVLKNTRDLLQDEFKALSNRYTEDKERNTDWYEKTWAELDRIARALRIDRNSDSWIEGDFEDNVDTILTKIKLLKKKKK